MTLTHFIDDLGILLVLKPIIYLTNLELINTFDDIGIFFVCKPLRYLDRFAEMFVPADSRSIRSLDSSWVGTATTVSVKRSLKK
jgi:hypothetical protein